jgi:hypothetical protein
LLSSLTLGRSPKEVPDGYQKCLGPDTIVVRNRGNMIQAGAKFLNVITEDSVISVLKIFREKNGTGNNDISSSKPSTITVTSRKGTGRNKVMIKVELLNLSIKTFPTHYF